MKQHYRFSAEECAKVHLARDILLSDLSQASPLPALAKRCGLSLQKMNLGFHHYFGQSPYALFMQERMAFAKQRLSAANADLGKILVTEVAMELGYSNISHFAAAFKKQYDISPSAARLPTQAATKTDKASVGMVPMCLT